MNNKFAVISGTGMYVPARMIKNDFFDRKYNRDMDSFLRIQRNIHTRYFMDDKQATSDLILPAAMQALEAARIGANDLDLIIVATDTPDYISPATAAVVQHKLGAKNAGIFDINAACAGFVTALDMAGKYIAADERYQNILVVGAYGMSKFFNWDDFKVTSVFADGAGAAIVSRSARPGILTSELYADGQYQESMGIYAGGTRTPITHQVLEEGKHRLAFIKKIPPEFNMEHWPRLTHKVLDKIKRKPDEVSCFFFTQINIQSINATMDALKLPRDRAHNIMDRFGYTGSACIPMAMADAVKQNKLKKGDLVMMLGSGGGVAMAALALEY